MYQKFRKLQKYSNARKCEIVENWRHCRHALQLHHLPGAHSEHQENLPSSSNHIHVWLCQVSKGKLINYFSTAGVCARLRVLQLRGGQHPGREHEHRLPRDQPRPPPRPRPLAGGDSDGDPRPEDVVMNMWWPQPIWGGHWTMQQRVGAICRGRSWWPPNDSSDVMADTRWMDASISRD